MRGMETTTKKTAFDRRTLALALLSFLCFFFILTAYYVLKSIRGSIFLATLGKEWIPWFYVFNAVASFFGAVAFNKLADILSHRYLIAGVQGFFIANLVSFWLFLHYFPLSSTSLVVSQIITSIFTVCIALFAIFTVTPFWSAVNSLFKARDGKRLYGFIGAGGTLGGYVGGKVAATLAHRLGTVNLIPVSAGILALSVPCFFAMFALGPPLTTRERVGTDKEQKGGALEGLSIIATTRYVALIAAIVILATFVQSVIDYQFHATVADAIESTDARTALFGTVHARISGASFIVQMAITPLVLSFVGVGAALAVLPLVAIAGAIFVIGGAGISTISTVYIISFASLYSINQASKELLYVPCSQAIKVKAKAFIDTFGYRLGAAICGITIGVLAHYYKVHTRSLSYMVLVAGTISITIAISIHRQFNQAVSSQKPDSHPE